MPLYPEVLRIREHTPIPYPFVVFTFGLAVESIKEFGGASLTLMRLTIFFMLSPQGGP